MNSRETGEEWSVPKRLYDDMVESQKSSQPGGTRGSPSLTRGATTEGRSMVDMEYQFRSRKEGFAYAPA